jgi:glycosyltransferase involved in cell wall biosynthesis
MRKGICKMKILFLNYEYPPLGGGAGVCTKYEAEGLANLGHKVTVITTWFDKEKEEEKLGNLKIIRLKSKREVPHKSSTKEKLSWMFTAKMFLKIYCKTNKFDICITNFTIPGGDVALSLKKEFNLPYIIISHGHDIPWFFPKQMFKFHLLTYFWIKNICNNAKKIVLLTSDMKKNADNFIKDLNKNIIIPNGCDTSKFLPNFSKKSNRFKIIFVGRLTDQKDPFTFLNSIKSFSENNTNFQVDICGDGPLKEKMEKYVKENNLQDIVKFLGWVSKDKMIEEYQSANLQVISSEAEAMSIALLESLSCGQYIISTPISGNNDVIKEEINGNFFKIKDSKQLTEKIEDYYKNKFKEGYQVPSKFLKDFRIKYDWGNIIAQWDKVLKGIKRK